MSIKMGVLFLFFGFFLFLWLAIRHKSKKVLSEKEKRFFLVAILTIVLGIVLAYFNILPEYQAKMKSTYTYPIKLPDN
jgi:prolipoprotein diacylglyceryltransferase